MAAWGDTHRGRAFHNQRVPDKRRRYRILRTIVLLIFLGTLLTAIWYGTRAEAVTIKTVDVSGGVTLDTGAIEQKIQSGLGGTYALLIPKRFTLLYPHDRIADMVAHLPRVADVTITRTALSALAVHVTEYLPSALWCPASADADTPDDDCFFIAENGFAFAKAPALRGSVLLRYRTEDRPPELGATFATAEYVRATERFAQTLAQKHGLFVSSITQTGDGDVQYHLRGGGKLLVAQDADIQQVFDNFDAILNSTEFSHIKSGDFIYVDLRFGNKAFVKETEVAHATSTETPQ